MTDVSHAAEEDQAAALDDHGQYIDRIDRTIVALLTERMRLGSLRKPSPRRMISLDTPESAAYQGAPGAFSEEAARVVLGAEVRLHPCPTLVEVFEALSAGDVDAAVVPIENSLAGAVPGCADLLTRHDVHIVAEHHHPIAHALMAAPGVDIGDLRAVHSHPVALAQCARFFRDHPRVKPVAAFDTAGAVAEMMTNGTRDAGAIASRRAAALYGAAVLADDVQDLPNNVTRFLRVERGVPPRPARAHDRTTVMCVLRHEPGALHRALASFATRGLNLTRIESCPIPERPFEYRFMLDIGPAAAPPALQAALQEVGEMSAEFRVVGHYEPVA